MSITKTDKTIYFSTGEGNFIITKDGAEYIIYNDHEMGEMPVTIYCQTPASSTPITFESNLISGVGCKTVKVYFECDNAFYVSKGSNVNTLSDYIIGFFNQVATLYANEDIAIQVSEIFAWTTPDPYVALTTTSAILSSFRTTRGTNYNGTLAHFLTTRNVGGGIAYVDAICNKAYAYGISRIYTTYSNFPTYSWTVNVVTHELGHNLGSPHTQSCSWSGGPIDNCVAQEGTCSPGPTPTNGGTIMSYCHTTSIGINFNNGFGPLPGNLIRSKVLNATCLPAGTLANPPSSLNTTNITSSSATLNWAATPSTINYTVQYKLASASSWTSAGTTTSASKIITGLTANSNYVWSVKSDCSAFSTNASFTTAGSTSSTCAAPINLSATNITQTGATLNWGAVSGATSYSVQYKTTAASTWSTVNATTNSVTLSGLVAGTGYNWQVKANCSGYSSTAGFTTSSGSTTCSAPTQLTTTNITQNGATLNWGVVSGATSYSVQFKTASASTWSTSSATTNSISISGLLAGTNYVWQVKANCSSYSSQASFTTTSSSSSGCGVPTNLNTTGITTNSATLTWSPVPNAVSYQVRYKLVGASGWTIKNAIPATTTTLTGLLTKRNYQWVMNAKCSNGTTSSLTTTKYFTTL